MGDNLLEIKSIPHDKEVENSVLGSIFIEPKLIEEVIDIIKWDMFYIEANRSIFTAMSYLHHNNEVIDYTNVLKRLEYKKVDISVDYVLELADCVPSTVNFQAYVDKLLDYAHKRDMYKIGEYLLTNDISGISSKNLVKMLEETIENVNVVSNIELTETKDYASEWLDDFDKPIETQRMFFGIKGLDDIVGIETTGMTGIAGTTGSGKSAFALTITKNLCKQGKHGLFITLEMSKKQVINRLIANMARVPHKKIKNKEILTKGERENVERAVKEIAEMNLIIYDRGSMSVEHLYNLGKKLKKQNKLDFIVVDYLQLLDTGKQHEGNEAVRIGYISRKLKMIAQDLYVPVFALSQLNRGANEKERGKRRKPELHDLKSSSSIEQDCNHVLMLHNASDGNAEEGERKVNWINIYVRKNREGETGKVYTHFYGDYVEFEEMKWNKELEEFEPVEQKGVIEITDKDLPF